MLEVPYSYNAIWGGKRPFHSWEAPPRPDLPTADPQQEPFKTTLHLLNGASRPSITQENAHTVQNVFRVVEEYIKDSDVRDRETLSRVRAFGYALDSVMAGGPDNSERGRVLEYSHNDSIIKRSRRGQRR